MSGSTINLRALRNLLDAVLCTDSQLNAFCLDYFPDVYKQFSDGMDRTVRYTLLLQSKDVSEILASLRDAHPQQVSKHLHMLEGNQAAATRNDLLDRLHTLLPAQFEELLFRLEIPAHYLSSGGAQSIRAVELVRYLEQGGRLDDAWHYLQKAAASPGRTVPARREMPSNGRAGAELQADVLLIVTTDVEREALLAAAASVAGAKVPAQVVHGRERSYHDLGIIGGARSFVVQAEMGTATVGGSLITTATSIGELSPSTILMLGIAFGVDPRKQPIGEILVSRQIQQYDIQRVGIDKDGRVEIRPRGDKATASPGVLSRLRAAKASFKSAPVTFGLLLSGEKLVDNQDYREALRTREPEMVGGEMEGGGLYVAAADRRISWCVVKAVCDYADGQKRENKAARQALAANNAAQFVLTALAQGGFASAQRTTSDPR